MKFLSASFTDILTKAVEASVKPHLWDDVCDRIVAFSGCVNCNILEYDPAAERCVTLFGSENLKLVAPDLRLKLLDGSANGDDRIYAALQQAEPLTFQTEASLIGVANTAAIPSNSFRESLLERTGAASRSGGRFNDIGPHVDALELHLREADALPVALLDAMGFLMPVIGKSIEVGRIVRRLTRGYGALLDAFDLFDFAAVICEADGALVIANSRFHEMARDGDAFVTRDGALLPRHASDHPPLTATIAASRRHDAAHRNLIATIRRRSGKLPLVAKAAPIRDAAFERSELILLLILDPEDDNRINTGGIEAFDLLSPAELDICDMLVRGYQTSEISNVRDTSIATVRSQIKSVSAKLACTSRLDLLRLAMATSVPVRESPTKFCSHTPNGG